MQMATWSPGCTPTERSNRLNQLAAASSSANVWVNPEPTITSAALSGWASTNAPGYTTAKVADQRNAEESNPGGTLQEWIRPSGSPTSSTDPQPIATSTLCAR